MDRLRKARNTWVESPSFGRRIWMRRSNGPESWQKPPRQRSKCGRSGKTAAAEVMSSLAIADIERLFRQEYGRAVAVLVRLCGTIDAAEEVVQDAFAEAVRRWPSAGLPPSPVGWIITT